jgi:hypothetical protein
MKGTRDSGLSRRAKSKIGLVVNVGEDTYNVFTELSESHCN